MSLRRYDSYRDSEIGWLGELPSHWPTRRMRRLVEIKKRIAGGEGPDVLSITQRGIRVRDLESNDGQLAQSYAHYQLVEPGDFAMNHMDLLTGWIDISNQSGVTSPDYRVFTVQAGALIYPPYLLHVLQLCYSGRIFYSLGQGASQLGRWRLSTEAFQDFEVPVPFPAEQVAIASFLDRETAKIDALVEEQRQLIELLREKRQAVISRAVTKGLDPSAPMKDSGVEWLGEVPVHWDVGPLKRYLRVLAGYAFPSADFRHQPTNTRLLRGVNVSVGQTRWDDVVYWERKNDDGFAPWELRKGDLVLGMDRPWVADGLRVAQLDDCDLPCLLLQRVAALRPDPRVLPDYLRLLLAGDAFYHHCVPEMTGVSVPHISPSQIGDFIVAIPSRQEQDQILARITDATTQADELMAAAEAATRLLAERRAALISAAVTGKIDVRDNSTAEAA